MISEIPKNKLWALCADEESLKTLEKYHHVIASNDHILIISPEAPQGAVEADDEIQKLLSPVEWAWLLRESQAIWKEWEREHHDEWMRAIDEFCDRFAKSLSAAKKAGTEGTVGDIEQEEKGSDADTSGGAADT